MDTIEVGSTVRLKAGGPVMIVDSFATMLVGRDIMSARNVEDRSRANCQWFEGAHLSHGTFPVLALKIVSDNNQ